MFVNELTAKTVIENILISSTIKTHEKVIDVAAASKSGLDDKTKDVLGIVHSSPQAHQFEPCVIRELQKNRQNPFAHEEALNVSKQDIVILCENHELAARVYRPSNEQNKTLPALIYFHGGGFVLGDINSHDKMLAQLCSQSGVVIISVAYRLAPETIFPGAVKDTQQAMDWIEKNALSLHLDPKRIAIGGDSAGANLATVYCLLNKEKNDFKPCFQLLIYPSIIGNNSSKSRTLFSENLLLTKELLHWFHNHYINKEQENDPRFNVMKFDDFSQIPPAFILTCGFDPLRDEGQIYVDKLKESGVTVRHSCYSDMFHGFINFGTLQQSKDAVSECAMILKAVTALK